MNISHEIQKGVHFFLKRGHKREDLTILVGYEIIHKLVREISSFNYGLHAHILDPITGKLPKDAQFFGVKLKKGYEQKKLVIFEDVVNLTPAYIITMESDIKLVENYEGSPEKS